MRAPYREGALQLSTWTWRRRRRWRAGPRPGHSSPPVTAGNACNMYFICPRTSASTTTSSTQLCFSWLPVPARDMWDGHSFLTISPIDKLKNWKFPINKMLLLSKSVKDWEEGESVQQENEKRLFFSITHCRPTLYLRYWRGSLLTTGQEATKSEKWNL